MIAKTYTKDEEIALLQAQLIQCTTAMREVSACMREWADYWQNYRTVQGYADKLDTARAVPVVSNAIAERDEAFAEVAEQKRKRGALQRLFKKVRSERGQWQALTCEAVQVAQDAIWALAQRNAEVEKLGQEIATLKVNDAFDFYQNETERTKGGAEYNTKLAVLTLGLTGEAGEVAELVKKFLGHGKPFELESLKKELGDVLWYLTRLGAEHGISLSSIANANVEKLRLRYPDGFVHGGGVREHSDGWSNR